MIKTCRSSVVFSVVIGQSVPRGCHPHVHKNLALLIFAAKRHPEVHAASPAVLASVITPLSLLSTSFPRCIYHNITDG